MANSRQKKIDAAKDNITRFYKVGCDSWKKHKNARVAKEEIEKDAAKLEINPFILRKARQFADQNPAKGYTKDELNKLCRQIERQTAQSGAIFGKSHLIRLLAVNKSERAELQESAITKGWTFYKLGAEISKRFGRRRAGGKRPRSPDDVKDVYEQIESRCIAWSRWDKKANVSGLLLGRGGSLGKNRQTIRALFEEAIQLLAQLHERVSEELKKEWRQRELVVEDDDNVEGTEKE